MQSLWPFASDTSSTATYEKVLAKLAIQINSTTTSLDKSRTRAYRSKSFWTLWSTLAYLIYTIVLVLVLGPQQWSLPHYAGLAGAPVIIYIVRLVVAKFWGWQIERQQVRLRRLIRERDEKIRQLKKATRYDSTQELLDKYGGTTTGPPSGERQGSSKKKQKPVSNNSSGQGQQQEFQTRTGIGPPPTANIPGRGVPLTSPRGGSRSSEPEEIQQASRLRTPPSFNPNARPISYPSPINSDLSPDEPGFAPNAFPTSPPSSHATYNSEPQHSWYDRILDVMLGEDETLAKNRLVLICASCRLVNGQAPPGVRTLGDVGRWKCGSCGAWNGVEKDAEKEVGRMVQKIQRQTTMERMNDTSPTHQYQETAESPGSQASTNESIHQIERSSRSAPMEKDLVPRKREIPDSDDDNSSNDAEEYGEAGRVLEDEDEAEDEGEPAKHSTNAEGEMIIGDYGRAERTSADCFIYAKSDGKSKILRDKTTIPMAVERNQDSVASSTEYRSNGSQGWPGSR